MTETENLTDQEAFDDWEAPPPRERMVVDLDGYEGPLDVLLELAKAQKVDLAKISILDLAEQYLAFIAELRRLQLEVAADYLVMAAWLAYLKSRMLLPEEETEEEEPTGAEMAAALAFQLRRLEAMRESGQRILALPQLRRDVFPRGNPEPFSVVTRIVHQVTLYDLLKAYAQQQGRQKVESLAIEPSNLYSVDEAIKRLREVIGRMPDWQTLSSFLPPGLQPGLEVRSAIASTFAASLELARSGAAQLRQDAAYGPIYVRKRSASEGPEQDRGSVP
ncbi:MAG: ScpA family protein [Alphaproteobacteria bacterium]|nr:ScpA family protein [Alphaproteobacteria bacterium]